MKKICYLLLPILLLLLVDDVKAQLKLGDQPTSVQKSVILDLQGSNGRQGVWLPRISDTTNTTGIDALNPPDGVMIYHTPSAQVMIRINGFWSSLQTTTKVGSTTSTHSIIEFQLGTVAGASKDMNYSLNSSTGVITLNIPDAAVDTRGVVTINSQTFGGLKTFNDGLTSLSTTTISGASSNASNLYLGITAATTPGTTSDRFLSVDNSGRVVLSQAIPSTRTMTINGTSYDLSANRTWNVGTVTSLTGGYGLNGGTITSTGTLSLDTTAISTRAWRQKGIDSVAGLFSNYSPSNRTLTINGTSYDLSANRTWSVGTVTSLTGGYGLNGGTITSSGTLSLDTTAISTRAWRQKGIDSVAALLGNYSPSNRTLTINGTSYDLSANRTWSVGTVTSLTGGYGLNGGTITSSGTLSLDTTAISTRAWRQKGIDSVAGLLSSYVPTTRTLNGLALSSNQTFAAGTSGTDFNISSSGTTHTFNLPTASASNRGLLSTTDWSTFNNKVSTSRTLTINGTSYDLSANRTWSVGTITSLTGGYGLNGGTITSSGTLSLDTSAISTRAWRQKGIDSVVGLLSSYVPTTRTLNGLALSSNQTFATGTSGTDFNISSSGTAHTFNIPDASSTARGAVTTGTQTFAGAKTFSTSVTVSGATSNASNLTLGITSATTPGTATDNVLTVNSSGVVTLNTTSVTAPTGETKIKSYSITMSGLPANLSSGSTTVVSFTVPGGGLSTTATVIVSPASDLNNSTTINWARVSNATTIKVSISNNGSGTQPFTNSGNATFNFTVMEF